MYRKYQVEKRYTDRDALLHSLEIQNEILKELKKLIKTLKKNKAIEKLPKASKSTKVWRTRGESLWWCV